MTSPAPSGGPSPLRLGGLALVGVAVVAAIIGLATLATNGGPETTPTAAPSALPPSSAAPAPPPAVETPLPPPSPLPTSDGGVPLPAFPPPSEGTPAPGGAPAPAPAPGEAPAPGAPAPAPGGAPAPPPAAAPPPGGGNGGNGGGTGDGGGNGSSPSNGRVTSGGDGVVRAPLRVYNNSRIEGLAARAADDFRRAGWEVTEVGAYGQGIIPVTTVYYRPGTDEEAPAKALGAQFGLRVNPRFEGLREASPGIIVIVTREYGTQ